MGETPRRVPVTCDTVTVLGDRVKAVSPVWRGIDWSDVILREQNTLMLAVLGKNAPPDHHLDVAWAHPEDDREAWAGTRYRVRPRRAGWRFVQVGDAWMLERANA